MNKIFVKNTNLKEFIDFALSLKEMKEVKEKGFPVPDTIIYTLDRRGLDFLQKEILKEKNMSSANMSDEFEVDLYGINFKFILK